MNENDLESYVTSEGDIGLFEFQIKRGVVNFEDLEDGDEALRELVSQILALCEGEKHEQAASILLPCLLFEFDPSQMDDEPGEFFADLAPVEFNCTTENCHVRVGAAAGLVVTISVNFEIPLRHGKTLGDIKNYVSEGGAWAAAHVSPGWTYTESDGDNVWFLGVKGRGSSEAISIDQFQLGKEVDSDLELARNEADDEGDNTLTMDVYTKDVDAALAAFKAALAAGATSVRISSNEGWETKAFENVNLMFDATPGSDVIALVKRPPFVRDPGDLQGGGYEGESGDDPDEDEVDEGEDRGDWGHDCTGETDAHEEANDTSWGDEELAPARAEPSTISLIKGQNLSLSKTDPALERVIIGLGWDLRAIDGKQFHLDASVFMLGENGKARSDADFIFYNQKLSGCGSVEHTGDKRTGAGEGDYEQIKVGLSKVPANVSRLAVTVTIHDAESRRQSFGQVSNAFIRVVNEDSGAEVVRYDLSEDYSTETAMIFGELYRRNDEWKFRAVGQGYGGGLAAMCAQFGIPL